MCLRVGIWGTGEMVTVALTEGSGFQHPQPSITPVPEDPAPSSDLHRHHTCGMHIYMQANVLTHKININ